MSYSGRNNLRDESDTLFAVRSLWILRRHCKSCETVQVLCVCLSSSSLALGRSLRSQDLLCSFRTMLYGLLYRPQGVPAVSVCHIPHSRQRCQRLYVDRTPESQPTLFDPVVFIGQRAIHQINLFRFKMVSRPTRHHHRISIAMQWRTAHCLIVWIGALSWVICANVDFRWNSVAETATTTRKNNNKKLD